MGEADTNGKTSFSGFLAIIVIALALGLGKAILVEIVPEFVNKNYRDLGLGGETISFLLLGFSAILGFSISGIVSRSKLTKAIYLGFGILLVGSLSLMANFNLAVTLAGAILIAVAFSLLNISGLPFALRNLSVRNITYGVGIYIGAGEVFTGIVENFF